MIKEDDLEMAHRLRDLIRPQPKACWHNSYLAMMAYRLDRGEADLDFCYVEGWLLIANGGLPIEHGWNSYRGSVVDVTLPGLEPADCYYPVHVYTYEQMMAAICECHILPFKDHKRAWRDEFFEVYRTLPCNAGLDFSQPITERLTP